jgi:hypothetical protein
VFPRGARYRIDGTLQWRDRRGLTLDGNGARLIAGAHGGPYRAHVRLIAGGDWTIRDLAVLGANPHGGRFDAEYQWQHGFDLQGVDGARLEHVTVSDVFGDDIYIGLSPTSQRWSQDITIKDSTGERSGRMGIAITAGRRVRVDGGEWSEPGLSTFDVEPNGRPGGVADILIENAVVGPGTRHWALNVAGRGPVSNITLRNNLLTGRPLSVRSDEGPDRPRNIVIEGNTSRVTFAGPGPAAMEFDNTDGVTVSRNTLPIEPGAGFPLVATHGSTRVDIRQYPRRKLGGGSSTLAYILACVAAALFFLVLSRRSARPVA